MNKRDIYKNVCVPKVNSVSHQLKLSFCYLILQQMLQQVVLYLLIMFDLG